MDSSKVNTSAKPRVALFAGSFDPFTTGHKSIVDRALPLFDAIVIGVGINSAKTRWMPLDERISAIRALYAANPKVSVESFQGLASDFAREKGADYLLRGVRSIADFEYERNMADANRMLTHGQLETILILSLPELAAVSSSLVRELARFGAPYTQFIPKP